MDIFGVGGLSRTKVIDHLRHGERINYFKRYLDCPSSVMILKYFVMFD
jgi:hypothetical protein